MSEEGTILWQLTGDLKAGTVSEDEGGDVSHYINLGTVVRKGA
jgi:hypothetical protein